MSFCVVASYQRSIRCIEQIMCFVVCVCAAQTVSLAEGARIRLSNEQNSLKHSPVVSAYPYPFALTIDKHPEIYLLNNQKNNLWRNQPLLLRYHVNPVHVFQPSFIGYRLNYDLRTRFLTIPYWSHRYALTKATQFLFSWKRIQY